MSSDAGPSPPPKDPPDPSRLLFGAVWIAALAMLLSTALQSWRLALGFALLAISCEIGQVVQVRREGAKVAPAMLLPSIGARRAVAAAPPFSGAEERMALAAVWAGSLGCAIVLSLYAATGGETLELLAFSGLVMNAFRITPMLPSDYYRSARWGGFLALILVYALVVAVVLTVHSPPLVLLATVAGIELIQRRRSYEDPLERHYMLSYRRARLAIALISLAAAVMLVPEAGSAYGEGAVFGGLD